MRRGRPPHDDILTPREWEVLALIEEGLTNEQIAERLEINVGTAKYHVGEILSKLQVESRGDAPAAARALSARPHSAGIYALLRLKPWWRATGAAGALLVLTLVGLLLVRSWIDDQTGPGPRDSGDTVGLGPDVGASPESGLATRPTPPQCVTGPRAENPTQQSPSGASLTMPTSERFGTVEEGEAWICLDVPQAQAMPGWRIQGVTASRSHSLSQFVQGMGFRSLVISYVKGPDGLHVELTTPGAGTVEGAGDASTVMIGGAEAKIWRKDRILTLQWEAGGVALIATIMPATDADLQKSMPLLESIR